LRHAVFEVVSHFSVSFLNYCEDILPENPATMSRLYVGRLSERATERDLEHFFRGYGRIRELVMKRGFAFVVRVSFLFIRISNRYLLLQEFEDYRDAEDAVYDLNGKELNGDR
jgi:arginine/serine-rich splicing factor 4/5/6